MHRTDHSDLPRVTPFPSPVNFFSTFTQIAAGIDAHVRFLARVHCPFPRAAVGVLSLMLSKGQEICHHCLSLVSKPCARFTGTDLIPTLPLEHHCSNTQLKDQKPRGAESLARGHTAGK